MQVELKFFNANLPQLTKAKSEQGQAKYFYHSKTKYKNLHKMADKYKAEIETFVKNGDENIAEAKLKRIKDSDIMVSLMEDSIDIKITVVGEGKFVRILKFPLALC